MRSGPVQANARTTPDSNLEPAVHGTWGDSCYEHSTVFNGELGVGHTHTATPREPNPATTMQPRTHPAPPQYSRRPTASATTTVIQGCGRALTFDAVRATQRMRIADPAHRDVVARAVAPGGSDDPRGCGHRSEPAVADELLQQRFPIERFEDLERWIVERSAKVRRQMAAQGATWTAPGRALEGERRLA